VEIAQRHNLSPVALAIGKLRKIHELILRDYGLPCDV